MTVATATLLSLNMSSSSGTMQLMIALLPLPDVHHG